MGKNAVANKMLHGGDYNPDQWLDYPDVLAEDLKFMKLSHTNAFSVGIFAWAALEVEEGVFKFEWLDKIIDDIAANGGQVALATPSGARPTWMSQKYPEVLRTNERREKHLHGVRHNHCFTSPVYREKVGIINRKLAERYKDHPGIFMWHVSNEYSGECHCHYCQDAFRAWIKNKYKTIEALNHAWWGPFWSHTITDWSQVESPSPIGETMVHGQNLDWKRFVTHQTIDFYKHEIESLREITPHIPVTTNFMAEQPGMLPYEPLDYQKMAQHVDIVTWDAYPAWHNDYETTAELAMKVGFINDIFRSMKQHPFLILECTPSAVNWKPINKAKRPGMHMLSSMQFVAHGSDSVMYFQWRKSRGSFEKFHGAVVDHDRSTENRVFKDVTEVGQALEKLSDVVGTMPDSEVAVVFDCENQWVLRDAQAYGQATKSYGTTCQQHYKAFWERDISVDVISTEQDFSKYKLLIVPMLYMMSEELIARLKYYVEAGGHLVMTYISGIVNETDLAYLNGWPKELQEIFGFEHLETDTYYPQDRNSIKYGGKTYEMRDYATIINPVTSTSLATYESDFYSGTTAVTEHEFGKGKTYFIGARLEQEFHDDFYKQITSELNIMPAADVKHDKGVSVQVRRDENNDYIFVMNFTEKTQTITLGFEAIDMLTEESVSETLELPVYGVKVLRKKK